jgi:hypothetical protein
MVEISVQAMVSGGTQSVPGMGTFREVKMRHFMT